MISSVVKLAEAVFQSSGAHATEADVVVRSVISSAVFENCVTLSSSIPLMVNEAVSVEVPFDVNAISAERMVAALGISIS